MRRASGLLVLGLALAAGCSLVRHRDSGPHIDALEPDSVSMPYGGVVQIVIRGHGFEAGTPGRNSVQFGTTTISDVPASEDGKEIRFFIPGTMPSGGDAAPRPLDSGAYDIRIVTAGGSSNAKTVRVYR
jgi:hypothetical protein